jgi:glyoxalase family protein
MALALVGIADAKNEPGWSNEDIPSEHAIRGLQGVTLLLESAQKTAEILTDVFAFGEVAGEGSVIRFAAAGDLKGNVVDICEAAGVLRGHQGRGSVHHIAFRAVDDVQQAQMTEKLIRTHGRHPTEQKDRKYFRSVYFREPGGVLFEIATDIPGFAVDESVESLGRDLELPTFLESRRKEIEGVLPVLEKAAS